MGGGIMRTRILSPKIRKGRIPKWNAALPETIRSAAQSAIALPASFSAAPVASAAASAPFETALPALSIAVRSEEHTSELQSLMRISYAVFCLKKKKKKTRQRKLAKKIQKQEQDTMHSPGAKIMDK